MAAFTNVTIDDSSPLIVYDPPEAWTHSSGNDAQGYTNSTYHGTSVNGASAKFTFNGTGIWLYGARKRDYGGFILLVDDDVVAYANATASAAVFGQTLGGLSDLKLGQHVVSIMNGGTGPIDLDGIVYETAEPQQLGSEAIAHDSYGQINSDMTVASSQTSSAFSTQSSSQFAVHPNAMLGPSNDPNPSPSSTAITSSLSATLTGSMTDASTSFVAPKALTVNGSPDARPWSTSGAYGQSAQPSVTSNTVSITSGQAQQASSPAVAGQLNSRRGLPTGAIIGIAIGSVVLLVVAVAFVAMFMRRRRRRGTSRKRSTNLPSPTFPLQDPETEFGYFFGGHGSSEKRTQYLGRSPSQSSRSSQLSRWSQTSFNSGATLRGYGGPEGEKDVTEMPTPVPPMFVRDSSYRAATGTPQGIEDGSDITDMYSRMDASLLARSPRRPELSLRV